MNDSRDLPNAEIVAQRIRNEIHGMLMTTHNIARQGSMTKPITNKMLRTLVRAQTESMVRIIKRYTILRSREDVDMDGETEGEKAMRRLATCLE